MKKIILFCGTFFLCLSVIAHNHNHLLKFKFSNLTLSSPTERNGEFQKMIDSSLVNNLKKHIYFLASDKLKGRQTGSKQELKAAKYIIKQYNEIGLESVLPTGFLQTFYFTPKSNPHDTLIINPKGIKKAAHNVVAFLNNHAKNTIVIGAHFDHLGMGEYGSSLYTGKDKQIHNGADDNASGTAAVIELARWLKNSNLKNNNYLFLNFSGEELGLFGSKSFMNDMPTNIGAINCMLNMDMVGRLNEEKKIEVGGVGTSPTFKPLIEHLSTQTPIKIKTSESGIGPSDHTSFYLKNIPVLFFFTGQHADYHKPTDDADKINYEGEALVINLMQQVLDSLNKTDKLIFTKTADADNKETPKFKVTLGIMPDYMYDGKGVRADGVTDGKPAAHAGLQAGDVIIKLGEYEVTDMQAYMKALSHFKKGDETIVTIKRKDEVKEMKLKF
ncbi:MAG: hypothetical protein RJA07_2850 [Bacteroidota bacterium]|jgi:hypothetical protein